MSMRVLNKYLHFFISTSKMYIIIDFLQISAKLFSDFCSVFLTLPFSYTFSMSTCIFQSAHLAFMGLVANWGATVLLMFCVIMRQESASIHVHPGFMEKNAIYVGTHCIIPWEAHFGWEILFRKPMFRYRSCKLKATFVVNMSWQFLTEAKLMFRAQQLLCPSVCKGWGARLRPVTKTTICPGNCSSF